MWRVVLLSAVVVVVSVACGEPRTPSAPSVTPPPTGNPVTQQVVRGVVYEVDANGRRPLAGAGVDISPEFQSWPPSMFTDQDGRFTGGSADRTLKIIATKAGYSQPCRVPVNPAVAEHEIHLVPNAHLANAGVPPSVPMTAPRMTGRVFERTPLGDEPVAGASVVIDFSGGDGWAPSATTVTDAGGRYAVCNVANASGLGLAAYVTKAGYAEAFVGVGLAAPATFDIELRRR